MSRYIDADALAKKLTDWSTGTVEPIDWSDIAVAPSIDIVRCGECRWRKPYSDKQLECDALGLGGLKFPNDFCSYGERTISKMEQVEDEPQTELVNDSPILAKDLVDDEFNPYDEECMRCKHLKLQCEFVPSYCKYEPRDEPQTEEPPMDEYYKDHDEFYEPQTEREGE